ncbi:MAG TPA: MBG domain-containing protein [Acidobacteriaceae bacterium]|nr:MBG domain-containing protein [Acidobacteriaceae bacterium]
MAQSSATLSVDTLGTTAPITSVARGTAVTLRAKVTNSSNAAISPGTVSFIDLSLPPDAQTVGTVQLLSNGTAAFNLTPAAGSHIYRASFNGTKTNPAAISPTETLSVTGFQGSAVSLAAAGTPADYTLTATVSGFGFGSAPTGTVNFIDTSNSNAVVGSANLSTTTFATSQVAQPTVTTGTAPSAIAIGDFNGDGIPDAVIANTGSGTLTVMLGNGDGTFTAGTTINTGGQPTAVIAADLNNDGILDLAVVDNQNGKVLIYLGNGDGTFTAGTPITAGSGAYGIAAGDVNLDGNLDLAVTLDGSNTAAVLLGNGDGTFTVGTPVPVGSSPRGVVIADFTSSGNPDIATANFGDKTVSVALGAGDGTFTKAANSPFNVGNGPIALAAADLNGDGDVDLAVANQTDGTVDVLLGGGNGDFALTGSPLAVDAQPSAIVAADFNGTGSIDLLTANAGPGTLSFLSNNGNATFAAAVPITAGTGADALAAADLNGEGRLGLIVANGGAANANAFLAAQVGSLSVTNITFPMSGPHMVEATYTGDSNFSTSTSSPVSLSSTAVTTTTTLAASPAVNASYGETITLTATITPATNGSTNAGGTVTFFDHGSTQIGSPVTVSGGVAALALPLQAVGSHSYTAVYSGSAGFSGSTSSAVSYSVRQSFVLLMLPSYTGVYGVAGTTTATLPAEFPVAGEPAATGTLTYQFPGFALQHATVTNAQATINVPAGLPVGTGTINVAYSGDSNYSGGSGHMAYTITGQPLTVTVNNATSVYGAAFPTFTGTITGAQNGDVLTATYSTTATPASAVGTYAITATVQGTNASNYTVTVVPGTLTITPAPLTISANNATRMYDTANPAFTGTITGTQNGDALALNFTTTATLTSNIGTYPLVPVLVGTNAGNYTVTAVNGVLTITPLSVTITANNATRIYGAANPAFTATVVPAVAGLTTTETTTATQTSPVGTYSITPAINGTLGSNYTTTLVDGTLTITQSPTTVLLQSSSASSTYGTSVTFTATVTPNISSSGVPTGSVSFYDGTTLLGTVSLVSGAGTFSTTALTVGAHTITATYAGDTNFTGSTSNSIAQTVLQATLTVTVANATRVYGAVDPTFTSTVTGAVGSDTFTVTYTTNETVTSSVGNYQITPTAHGSDLASYNLVYVPGTLTVTPAPLTIEANNATRQYGMANPIFTGGVNGAVNGDLFTLSFSTTAVTLSDVGTYPIVPAAIGPALANYTVTVVDGTLTITQATGIVVTAGNATRVYGTANPVFTGTVSGTFASLGFTVSGTTTATITSDAGTYPIVPVLNGVNPADYVATIIDGVLTISPAGSTIVLVSANPTAAAGSNVNLTATVTSATTGTPAGQVFFYAGTTFLGASPLAGGVASLTTNAIPAGTNTITARYNGNTDFTASVSNSVTETITSNLPVLTATANSFTRVVNTANPTFTGTITGALNGDTFTETFTTTATISSPPGTYSIIPVVTGTNLANYQLSIVPGVLTITQTGAALVLTANPTTAAVGAPVLLTAVLTGQNGIVPTGNVLFYDGTTLLGTVASVNGTAQLTVSTLAAGTHALTADSAGDSNYGPALSNSVTETITNAGGGTGADYTITATPAGLTIIQGNSASVALTFTPVNGYTGQITLGCVTLPQNASCTFTPATFTLSGTTPVTVTLTVNTSSSVAALREPMMPGQSGGITSLAGFALLPAMLLAGIFGWRRRSGFAGMRLLVMLLAATTMLSLAGCVKVVTQGSTSNSSDAPLGTSTITITATPQNATTGVSHTLPLVISVTQ